MQYNYTNYCSQVTTAMQPKITNSKLQKDVINLKNLSLHLAIEKATLAHSGQKRKGTNIPYIVHPFEVAQILTAAGCNEQAIIAGLFHDLIEDTDTSFKEISVDFGQRVAEIVQACTEQQYGIWEARKSQTVRYMNQCEDIEILQVSCADKLSNLRSMQADLIRSGEQLWERFKRTKEKINWYYGSMIAAYRPQLGNYSMFKELESLYQELFQ